MPMPAHLAIEGQNQGKIDGSCEIQGREGTILIQAIDHTVEIPKSPQTGLPTGKRIHGPITLTAEVDKATPKIFQALCSGEQLSSVQLDFYRISPQGSEELYYTIKMENAIITNARTWMPNALDKNSETYGHMIDYGFTYEKIIWTFAVDGIEAEDAWKAPK